MQIVGYVKTLELGKKKAIRASKVLELGYILIDCYLVDIPWLSEALKLNQQIVPQYSLFWERWEISNRSISDINREI